MAVDHLKSTPITNADSLPRIANNSFVTGGELRASVGTLETIAAGSVGSTYRLARVPSTARVHRVIFAADASGATGQLDIGLYQTAENGGAVVDADFFASAIDPGGGAIAPTDVTHESGEYPIEDAEMPLWKALGLSADPFVEYDIAATAVTEAMANASTLTLKVEYVV